MSGRYNHGTQEHGIVGFLIKQEAKQHAFC